MDEAEFLAGYDAGQFERLSVAVDLVLMSVVDGSLAVLLLQRDDHPFRGRWALPGGFVGAAEGVDEAARRVLAGKARMDGAYIEQLYTFGAVDRDPRTRIVSIAHFALLPAERFAAALAAAPELRLAKLDISWPGEAGGAVAARDGGGELLPLAFDHDEILGTAVKRLRGKLDYTPVGFQLLPAEFTLRALQDVHEAVRGEAVNKDSFRRRMLASGFLEATGAHERDASHRPAELYRFVRRSAV